MNREKDHETLMLHTHIMSIAIHTETEQRRMKNKSTDMREKRMVDASGWIKFKTKS